MERTFGARLLELRMENNITQEELAHILKVDKSTISKYEKSKRFPDEEMLNTVKEYFNVSFDYLLGHVDDKNSFVAEHTVDGHTVKVIADYSNFPEGFSEKDAAEYLEIAKAMKLLGLTKDDLELSLRARQLGIIIQDLELINKLKILGIKFESDN